MLETREAISTEVICPVVELAWDVRNLQSHAVAMGPIEAWRCETPGQIGLGVESSPPVLDDLASFGDKDSRQIFREGKIVRQRLAATEYMTPGGLCRSR